MLYVLPVIRAFTEFLFLAHRQRFQSQKKRASLALDNSLFLIGGGHSRRHREQGFNRRGTQPFTGKAVFWAGFDGTRAVGEARAGKNNKVFIILILILTVMDG